MSAYLLISSALRVRRHATKGDGLDLPAEIWDETIGETLRRSIERIGDQPVLNENACSGVVSLSGYFQIDFSILIHFTGFVSGLCSL